MVGSSKGNHPVGLVADYWLACLEEELCLVQLHLVSTCCRSVPDVVYLFLVELPSLGGRYHQGRPQRLGDGHSQVDLGAMSATRR